MELKTNVLLTIRKYMKLTAMNLHCGQLRVFLFCGSRAFVFNSVNSLDSFYS